MRLAGRFPYVVNPSPRKYLHFGWVVYSAVFAVLQIGGVYYTSLIAIRLSDNFDEKIFATVTAIICFILGLTPFLTWVEAPLFCAYLDKWTTYQDELQLFDVFLDIRLQKWLLLCIFALIPTTSIISYFLDVRGGNPIAFPFYLLLQIGSYLVLTLWFFMIFFIEDTASRLLACIGDATIGREVATLKKLWLTLANLTVELGQVFSLTLILFMITCSLIGITNSYSLLFILRDCFSGNCSTSAYRNIPIVTQVGFLIVSAFIIIAICENGHRCTVSVGSNFLKEVLKINFSLRNENTQRELRALVQTILLRYPDMALGGYFTVNRRLLTTKRTGMDPKLVKLEHALPVTVKQFVIETTTEQKPVEEKKVESFKWEDSLRTLTTLMKTGHPPDPKPPPKKKKVWKWFEKQGGGKQIQHKGALPPVDYSSVGLKSFEVEVQVEPRSTTEPLKTDDRGKFLSKSVRFRRNGLTSMAGLDTFLEQRFADPSSIEWLDLSYNSICEINPVLSMMPKLKMLYLHSNCINDLDEVRKLRYFPNLRSLTLFGNPIEASIDYRLKIMAAIPTLKRIDWTVISPRERVLARFYVNLMKEKDREEMEELKRQEKAAEDRREKKRKAEEKRRRRREEQKEAAKGPKPEPEQKDVIELDFEPIKKKEVIEKEDSLELVEEELTEEETTEEEVTEESELKEDIIPISLADPGPLDVKGKYKLHPDPLSTVSLFKEVEEYPSDTSLFSTETVTLEQIENEFNVLKEMEANADHNWGSTIHL